MADTPVTISSLSQLPPAFKDQLRDFAQNPNVGRSEIRHFLRRIPGIDESSLNVLEAQVLRTFPAKRSNDTETKEPSAPLPQTGAGSIVGALAGSALAVTGRDTSDSGKIVNNLNELQADKIFSNSELIDSLLNADTQDVLDSEKGVNKEKTEEKFLKFQQLLGSNFDADDLFAQRVDMLEKQTEKAGGSTNDISRKYNEIIDRENPLEATNRRQKRTNGKIAKQKEALQKLEEARKRQLFNVFQSIEKDKKLTAEEKLAKKKEYLKQYVRTQQQLKDFHLHNMLSKRGLLRMGRVSIFSRQAKKNLIQAGKEEAKKASKTIAISGKNEDFLDTSVDNATVLPTSRFTPPSWEEASKAMQGGGSENTQPPQTSAQQPSSSPANPLSNAAKNVAQNAAKNVAQNIAKNPAVWPYIAAVLGLIFLIVIIVAFFLIFNPTNVDLQIEQEQCGDFAQSISAVEAPDKFAQFQAVYFHIENNGGNYQFKGNNSKNPHFDDALTAYKAIFNTLCILYGHSQGGLTGNSAYNTFAKLLLGDRLLQINGKYMYMCLSNDESNPQRYPGNNCLTDTDNRIPPQSRKPKAAWIQLTVSFNDQIKDCYSEFFTANKDADAKILKFFLFNPQLCSPYKLQYLLAQNLAHIIIIQQDRVAGRNNSVFNKFTTQPNSTGVIGQDGLLPDATCQENPNEIYGNINGKTDGTIGEDADFQQQRNCFGDMVANYLTYAKYTQQQPDTPAATSSDAPNPPEPTLSNYPSGYPHYFLFAKNNLFDGQEFFVSTANSSCPAVAPTTPAQMSNILSAYFNMTLTGTLDTKTVTDVYQTVCSLSGYNFLLLLHLPNIHISIAISPDTICKGDTNTTAPLFYQIGLTTQCSKSPGGTQFLLTHEFGHIIQQENPQLFNSFCVTVYRGIPDSENGCLNRLGIRMGHPQTIPTYNCLYDYSFPNQVPDASECFADMAGSFLTYSTFHDTRSVNGKIYPPAPDWTYMANFPSKFPDYYSFAQTMLFIPVAGGATHDNNLLATIATSIATRIDQGPCGGRVTSGNIFCLYRTTPSFSANALTWLAASVNETGTLQCVGFVQAVTAEAGKLLGRGNAKDFAGKKLDGYTWILNTPSSRGPGGTFFPHPTIQVGDIPVWSSGNGGCQHIAVVTQVYGTYSFRVAQANGNAGPGVSAGSVDFANYTYSGFESCALLGWQRKI